MEIIKSLTSATKRGASKVQNFVKNHQGVVRTAMMMLLFVSVTSVMAQTPAGSAGSKAFTAVTSDLKTYVPLIRNLCYALAGIVAIGGAISVYIAMNNEENDAMRKIHAPTTIMIFFFTSFSSLFIAM